MKVTTPSRTARPHTAVWVSMLVILLMTLTAVFAPLISPYDPTRMQIGRSYLPPAWYDMPLKDGTPEHPLGTDLYGRDIFSHVIHGARAAMFLVLIAIPLTALLGVAVGVVAGMENKLLESLFLRLTDVIHAVPAFMFAVIIVFIFRDRPTGVVFGGLLTLTLAYALINWVGLARLVYTAVLKVRHLEFMEASHSLGAGAWHQIFKHILPHISHLVIVWIVNNIPAVILLEALLGYLGIRILPVTDGTSFQDLSWGGLILFGRSQLNQNPFMLFAPTLCILALSLSFSTLGEYLNERLNPQLESNEIV